MLSWCLSSLSGSGPALITLGEPVLLSSQRFSSVYIFASDLRSNYFVTCTSNFWSSIHWKKTPFFILVCVILYPLLVHVLQSVWTLVFGCLEISLGILELVYTFSAQIPAHKHPPLSHALVGLCNVLMNGNKIHHCKLFDLLGVGGDQNTRDYNYFISTVFFRKPIKLQLFLQTLL